MVLSLNFRISTNTKKRQKIIKPPRKSKIKSNINSSNNNSKFGKSLNKSAKRKNKEIMIKIFADTLPDPSLDVSLIELTKKKLWNFANNFCKKKTKILKKIPKICTILPQNFYSVKLNSLLGTELSEAFYVSMKTPTENPKNAFSGLSPIGS